jgi:GNAT superfamily N-acetyltransferase
VSVSIRKAGPADTELIFSLVRELADYEKLSSEVGSDPQAIAAVLFAGEPRVFCEIAEWNGQPAGFAVWFLNFSTFRGRYGMYLEDIFVRSVFRNRGIGRAMMARLAQRCIEEGWGAFEWAVLGWNTPSIEFYKSLGAQVRDDWKICRLSGDALAQLAYEGSRR